MSRILAGYDDSDFEQIFIQNVLTFNGDVGDFTLEEDNGNLIIAKGGTEIASFDTDAVVINNLSLPTIVGDFTVDSPTFHVDSTNNRVGVGTLTPGVTLDVVGDINASGSLTVTGDLTVDPDTFFVKSATNQVGINTATPGYSLDVSGVINASVGYKIATNDVLTATTLGTGVVNSSLTNVGTLTSLTVSGDLAVDTNTLFVDVSTNRVGINDASPTFSLDVSGDINGTGQYYVSGVNVLNATTLGAGIVNSSLTSVGTLTDLTVTGDLAVNGNTFFVDVSANNVGINTGTPDALSILHANSNANTTRELIMENGSSGANAITKIVARANGGDTEMFAFSSGYTSSGYARADSGAIVADGDLSAGLSIVSIAEDVRVYAGGGTDGDLVATFNDGGGVDIIGTIDTTNNYMISGTTVLNGNTLGSTIINSSVRNVGTQDEDLNMGSNDIVSVNEVFPSVCNSIGSLGFILLDEQMSVTLPTTFGTLNVSLGDQTLDNFAYYKMIIRASIDGDGGGNLTVFGQFVDGGGAMATANGHYQQSNDLTGTTLVSNTGVEMSLLRRTSTTVVNNFLGQYTISTGGTTGQCMINGDFRFANNAGTSIGGGNMVGGLTTNETITTKITGLSLRGLNFNGSGTRQIFIRIYRML